jgi:hypothetical protein
MLTVKHKYVGFISQLSIFTLISPIDKVQNWNSDSQGLDVESLIYYTEYRPEPLNSVFSLKISESGHDWLIFSPLSKSVKVFKAENSIALLAVEYMDRKWSDDFSEMEFTASETPFMKLPNFGGPIAIFDALVPGPKVVFKEEGLYLASSINRFDHPDTAIIHVKRGDYQIRDIMYEEVGITKWEGIQIYIQVRD